MSQSPIYLDYNATTPIDPRVADAMIPHLREHHGNPSSGHCLGVAARAAVDRAREQVARLVGATVSEILFTSGGTESNNMVILGTAEARRERGKHIVISSVEHPAVTAPCEYLARTQGFEITELPVDATGRVDVDAARDAIRDDTVLVSVMHANNEVGALQPIAAIAEIARAAGAWMHTDAAQSLGKVPVDLAALGVDFISLAGHKIYAPAGIGALVIRDGMDLPKMMHGAGHESGRRAGTENVLEIVGLGEGCEIAGAELDASMARSRELVVYLDERLRATFGDRIVVNGPPADAPADARLPNTLNVSLLGEEGATVLARVGDRLCASAGAACHSGGVTISHVLKAMGIDQERGKGAMRLSVGRGTTKETIDAAVAVLAGAVG